MAARQSAILGDAVIYTILRELKSWQQKNLESR